MKTLLPKLSLLGLMLLALAGCVSDPVKPAPPVAAVPTQDPNAKENVAPPVEGAIRMSSGFDPKLMRAVDEGRQFRIYTQMSGIEDAADSKLLFPAPVAAKLGISNKQMSRRLMDALQATRRFTVFNDEYSVVQDQAQQKWGREDADLVVDCKVVDARQELLDIAPYKKPLTTIKLSMQLINRLTGESLFERDVAITATWGAVQGEGALLAPNVSLASADVQNQLGNDYERALSKALDDAVERIDAIIRPIGRVVKTRNGSTTLFGGSKHGFQSGDTVIVFRSEVSKLGNTEIVEAMPVAVAKCDAVGTESSLCDITRSAPGLAAQSGDYALLSDASARSARTR